MNTIRSAGAKLVAERLQTLLGAGAQPVKRAAAGGSAATAMRIGGEIQAELPAYVVQRLADFHLLRDLPFRYLVPDTRLLPSESIRFFTLDGAWLDALADGALELDGQTTRERARTRAILPRARIARIQHLPFARDVHRGRISLHNAAAARAARAGRRDTTDEETTISGFLLRSALVSNWPGLQVRAWASDDVKDVPNGADPETLAKAHPELVVTIDRLDRISPSVLLALFHGVPRLVWLEEPHHGIQYGVEETNAGWSVAVRDAQGNQTGASVQVPMRSPGVVDVTTLAARLPGVHGSAAALAVQLIQAPSRQRFAAGT